MNVPKFDYVVLGSGLQGTAAAYDLARWGEARRIRVFDLDARRAEAAADRVNRLVGSRVIEHGAMDVRNAHDVSQVLTGAAACLSAAPYALNEHLARVAIESRAHFVDLGGNTQIVERQLALDARAKEMGVSIIPDCGVAPGMANTLAVHLMAKMDAPKSVRIFCGGLPQRRDLPLGYKVLFSIGGLTNEYTGKARVLRHGRPVEVDTLEEPERVAFHAPIGELEACTTSGGTSTCTKTFSGRLETYEYKTLRYPGHFDAMRLFKQFGFLDEASLRVGGVDVAPRAVFHRLMERAWTLPNEPDLLILRVNVSGTNAGKETMLRAEVIDRYDTETGFSAMERTTAFSAAIVTAMQVRGQTPIGATPVETGVSSTIFLNELSKRKIDVTSSTHDVDRNA